MTAIGTVALAVVTLAVILTTIILTKQEGKRTDQQLANERGRHEREIADERALADKRLAEQLAHSDIQLADERTHSIVQIQEERRLTQEREQLIEAYAVQVFNGITSVTEFPTGKSDPEDPSACPLAIVVNRGHYTITDVHAHFVHGSDIYSVTKIMHFSAFYKLATKLLTGESGQSESQEWPGRSTTLTPGDPGLRMIGLPRLVRELIDSYPVVQWTDHWGTRWEHSQGQVQRAVVPLNP